MVYTVTFNPAIDYCMQTGKIDFGKTNRSSAESLYFGGKGINVAVILVRLGVPAKALGFIAGFTGDALEKAVAEYGVETDFIRLESGYTRINVKLKGECETEINAQGPAITEKELETFFEKLDTLTAGDTLVLAGSVPGTLPKDTYERILERLDGRGIRFVVDATKELLSGALKYRPYLIKPNIHELSELIGKTLTTDEEIVDGAEKLRQMGARNVLVSLGKDGALLLDEFGNVHRAKALGGKPKNTVGAGDSMVAGFIAGAARDYDYALLLGSAAGGATACASGLATREEIEALLP